MYTSTYTCAHMYNTCTIYYTVYMQCPPLVRATCTCTCIIIYMQTCNCAQLVEPQCQYLHLHVCVIYVSYSIILNFANNNL